jgi:hypothetical protein
MRKHIKDMLSGKYGTISTTGVRCAFCGTTATISFLGRSRGSQKETNEILPVPHRKHSLGLGAAATRF